MLEERLIKLSVDGSIQNPSLNYKEKYETCVGHFKCLNITVVLNTRFFCIKSEFTILQPICWPPFVRDDELSATYVTRYLIFNEKSQVIYSRENEGPPFSPVIFD